MKSNPVYLAAAAGLIAFWWYNRSGGSVLDSLPINLPPYQQSIYRSLFPTVDNNGTIVNPVNENVIIPFGG